MKNNKIYIIHIAVVCLTLISLGACYVNPNKFNYLGFVTWCIPIFIVLNSILFCYWLRFGDRRYWYSALTILACGYHIKSTFQISIPNDNATGVKVLSYNTRVFNVYNHLGKKNAWKSTTDMSAWLVEKDFDIMCFQEFYYQPDHKTFNTISNLKKKSKFYHYFYKSVTNRVNGQFGMAIFSKYKIIDKGVLRSEISHSNMVLYVDVIIKADTVRVYNCHLISNNLNDSEIPDATFNKANNKKVKSVGGVLKRGFAKRGRQVDSLVKHMESCKYKIILCGDLNDLPYSYTYRKISASLDNTFEAKGNGFGFTFNGKVPFLRIDNIFVSEGIKTEAFTTHHKVKYSDHYPISALLKIQ